MTWRTKELRYAAENPNSSIGTLLQAAEQFPDLVLANPTFMVELVIDPGVLEKLSMPGLVSLVGRDEVPEAVLDYGVTRLARSPLQLDLFNTLMTHRRLSGRSAQRARQLVKVLDDANEAGEFHRHVFTGDDAGPAVQHLTRHLYPNLRLLDVRESLEGLGLHNAYATQTALRYTKGTDDATAEWVASAPFAAPSVLAYMAQSLDYRRLRGRIARNRNAPTGVVMTALEYGEVKLTELVDHPGLAEGARRELLSLRDPEVDYALAGNPSLGEDEQFELIQRGEASVLARLALNEHLTHKAQYYLAALQDRDICRTLLQRPDLGAAALNEMVHSHHAVIAMLARDYGSLSQDHAPMFHKYRARFETRRPERLEQLIIATSSNVEPEILGELSRSIHASVRLAVAAHPATPAESREWLVGDVDVRVAKAAREGPSLPV